MIAEAILPELRRRRAEGESLKVLAAEVGVTWQKLEKAIRNGLPLHPGRETHVPRRRASTRPHRPRNRWRRSTDRIASPRCSASKQ